MKPVAYWMYLCTNELRHLRPNQRFIRSAQLWKEMTPAQRQKVRDHAATLPICFPQNTWKRGRGYKRYMKKLMHDHLERRMLAQASPRATKSAVSTAMKQLSDSEAKDMILAARKVKRAQLCARAGTMVVAGHLAWAHKRARELREAQPDIDQRQALAAAMADYKKLSPAKKERVRSLKLKQPASALSLPKYILRAAGELPVPEPRPTMIQRVKRKIDAVVDEEATRQRTVAVEAGNLGEKEPELSSKRQKKSTQKKPAAGSKKPAPQGAAPTAPVASTKAKETSVADEIIRIALEAKE